MNTYILTFHNPKPPSEIKIGYTLAKVENTSQGATIPRNMDIWKNHAQGNQYV